MFQGCENLEKLAHFRHVQGAGGDLQRLHPPRLHRLLRDAAGRARWSGRCSWRPTGCAGPGSPRRTCATRSTWSRRRSGSTCSTGRTAASLAHAAAGDVRHVPQRARRLRRLRRPGAGHRRRRRGLLRQLLRAGQRGAHGRRRLRRRRGRALVERHFGDVPARPAPDPARLRRAGPGAERRESYTDALAPLPALAVGWRVPDPITDLAATCRTWCWQVLTDGDASRLQRRLVHADGMVTDVWRLGLHGRRWTSATPTRSCSPPCTPRRSTPTRCCARSTRSGPAGRRRARRGELRAAPRPAGRPALLPENDGVLTAARRSAPASCCNGRAELPTSCPELLGAVTRGPDRGRRGDACAARAGRVLASSLGRAPDAEGHRPRRQRGVTRRTTAELGATAPPRRSAAPPPGPRAAAPARPDPRPPAARREASARWPTG